MIAAFRIWGTTLALLLGTLGFSCTAQAGHPWGIGHGHYHHGLHHGYGLGYGGYSGYRSVAIYPTSLWAGSYRWGGYRGLGYSRVSYSAWGYGDWYARPVGYTSFYANYYLPMTIYPRVDYYAPSAAYYVPTYSEPSYCLPTAFDYGPSVVVPSDCVPAYCDTCDAVSESASGTALQLGSDAIDSIPDELLASADAIFQAGGYQQAATAYAQLHVRYGSSNLIFGRRFVAQVACGDYDQAAVVLASAQGAGFPIDRSTASSSDWSQLLAAQAEAVNGWTEGLAQHALQAQGRRGPLEVDQHEALELMATWLNLTGQPERAGLFLAMAERLSAEENLPQSSFNDSPTSIAAIEQLPTPSHATSVLVLRQE